MSCRIFPGNEDSLELLRLYVQDQAAALGLPKKSIYKLILAIDEISTNIILYGYQDAGRSGDVQVDIETSNNQMVVTLEDTAVPFDPLERDLPTEDDLSKPLDEREIGGLGIFLTVNGVDQFRYEYVNNRNRNIFVMNLPV